jgi:hypothetical protein
VRFFHFHLWCRDVQEGYAFVNGGDFVVSRVPLKLAMSQSIVAGEQRTLKKPDLLFTFVCHE